MKPNHRGGSLRPILRDGAGAPPQDEAGELRPSKAGFPHPEEGRRPVSKDRQLHKDMDPMVKPWGDGSNEQKARGKMSVLVERTHLNHPKQPPGSHCRRQLLC